jgi:hypothetical protein
MIFLMALNTVHTVALGKKIAPDDDIRSNDRNNNTADNGISCKQIPIADITANASEAVNVPQNAADGNNHTRWSAPEGSSIRVDMGTLKSICSIEITWYRGNERQNNFVATLSNDTSIFAEVLKSKNSGKTLSPEVYLLNRNRNLVARYVEVTVNENSVNGKWASITEIRVNGDDIKNAPPSVKIIKPIDNSTYPVGAVITVEGSTTAQSTNAGEVGVKLVQVHLDRGNYITALPKSANDWSRWSLPINFSNSSLGSHRIVAKSTDNTGSHSWNSINVMIQSASTFDKFGIKKIYPTKSGNREWYVNMDNPKNDKILILDNRTLAKQPDGSWQIGSTEGLEAENDTKNDREYNGKFHIIIGVNTPPGEKEWQNVEITGYAKVIATSGLRNVIQWYARGANHTDRAPCEGTSLKGRLHVNGDVGWVKEIWHAGGYTEENATAKATGNPITGRWIGWKVVMYNINHNKAVKMESFLDDKNNNQWRKVTDFTDKGRWYSSSSDKVFYSADCGYPKDYIITNSGPVAAFRSDGIRWNFEYLSVREIQPVF